MLVSVFLPAKWAFKWYCPLRIYEAPCTWGAEDGAANLSHPCRWGGGGDWEGQGRPASAQFEEGDWLFFPAL